MVARELEVARSAARRLLVVSAPSGAGKTTLCERLRQRRPELVVSISYTTRAPRGQERDGVEYRFVDDARFDRLIADGALLEWAFVHGRRYGTARADVEATIKAGATVLFDIDVQGGRAIHRAFPEAALVFVLPPSIAELERRLRDRLTESAEQIAMRLENAAGEIEEGSEYEFHVVNDDLDRAIEEVEAILDGVGGERREGFLSAMVAEARERCMKSSVISRE